MTHNTNNTPAEPFTESVDAQRFIDSGPSRDTDIEVMQAIVSIANTLERAEHIWRDGLRSVDEYEIQQLIDKATDHYPIDAHGLRWGAHTLAQIAELDDTGSVTPSK